MSTIFTVVAILVAAAAIYLFVEQKRRDEIPSRESDGRIVAKIIDVKLEKVADIRVMRLSGTAQGTGCVTWWHVLHPCRVFKAPASVDYFVDVSKLRLKSFYWDDDNKQLTVNLPDVRVGSVNIDTSRVTLDRTDGTFVPRGAMVELQRKSSIAAQSVARKEAQKPENIKLARHNARSLISQLFRQPLHAAGIDAEVRVRFDGEASGDNEQPDRSRSLSEIFAEGL